MIKIIDNPNYNNNYHNMKNMDPSTMSFVFKLQNLLENETYDYCFYDFERENIKEKNKMYITMEQMKNNNNKNIMKSFCDEINASLLNYDITHICNIIIGKTYKYKNRADIPIQIENGYYYSFTVVCKKKINK